MFLPFMRGYVLHGFCIKGKKVSATKRLTFNNVNWLMAV